MGSSSKIREVLRLKASGLSYRAIARACLIGKETVREYLGQAAEAGLTWPLPEELSEEELERRLFPREPVSYRKEAEPDWACVSRELRKKGVTRHLLWEEYRGGTPAGEQSFDISSKNTKGPEPDSLGNPDPGPQLMPEK